MKNLQMSLKKNWFEMTKSGEKTEDYRDLTPYWCRRFVLINGESCSKSYCLHHLSDILKGGYEAQGVLSYKPFTQNTMTLGYPKKGDKERTLILEHKGIEVRTGNSDWGAEPNKVYFVVKHGAVL